jgi:hypothetical protein
MRARSMLLLALVGLLSPAAAAAQDAASTVAVVPFADAAQELSAELRRRLHRHALDVLGEAGTFPLVSADGPPRALRVVARRALLMRLTQGDGRRGLDVLLVELDTSQLVARGYAPLPDGAGEDFFVAALDDALAQLLGRSALAPDAPPLPPEALRYEPAPSQVAAPEEQAIPVPPPTVYVPPPEPPPPDPHALFPEGELPEAGHGLDLGVHAEVGDFVGLAQLGLVSAAAESPVTLLQLAGFRAEAGSFRGLVQLGPGAARATTSFVGGLQLSFSRTTARDFRGLGQLALVENEATGTFVGGLRLALGRNGGQDVVALGEAGAWNASVRFTGGLQLGLWNGAESGDTLAAAQLGFINDPQHFFGGVQLGVASVTHFGGFVGLAQMGLYAYDFEAPFTGVLQLGGAARVGTDFRGVLQLGGLANTEGTFSGVAQLGVISYVGNNLVREVFGDSSSSVPNEVEDFQGVLQLGALTLTDSDFRGVLQAGLLTGTGESFEGVAQLGLFNYVESNFDGLLQLAAVNYVDETFTGLFQVGAASLARQVRGAQLGALLNVTNELTGLQVGLVNYAGRLRGLQLGLVNVSDEGGLPISPIANLGF